MARDWIDRGLRSEREREAQWRVANERRLHQTALLEKHGPELMRQFVAEIGAAVDEYVKKSARGPDVVAFEALPHEGFRVEKPGRHGVALECRPDYAAHLIYCNMTTGEGRDDTETRELVFSLRFVVETDRVELGHDNRRFHTVGDAAEYLLTPVLFPAATPQL